MALGSIPWAAAYCLVIPLIDQRLLLEGLVGCSRQGKNS
jgi:hypothetical protein